MIVAKEIVEVNSFSIVCKFNNGEVRKLEVDKIFADKLNDTYIQKILTKAVFDSVKIGDFGQLYWENVAQMKDLDGSMISCEYDMSPEFVYYDSNPVNC